MERINKTHLLETWLDTIPPEKRRLGLILGMVGVLHILSFFMIEVRNPPLMVPSSVKARVSLAAPTAGVMTAAAEFWAGVEQSRQFLIPRDPVLLEGERAISTDVFLEGGGGESTTLALTAEQDFLGGDLAGLPERAAKTLQPARQTFAPPVIAAGAADKKTRIQWDSGLQKRMVGNEPDMISPAISLLAEAGVTVLDVAVTPDGDALHVMVRESCGRSSIDQLAVQAVRQMRFTADSGGNELVWGKATVFWNFQAETAVEAAPKKPE